MYAFASLNKSIQIVGYNQARNNKGIQSIQSIIVKSSLFLFQIINCQAMDDYIGSSQFLALQQISQFQLFNLDLVIGHSISFILLFNLNSFILNGPINSLFIRDCFCQRIGLCNSFQNLPEPPLIIGSSFLSHHSSLDHLDWRSPILFSPTVAHVGSYTNLTIYLIHRTVGQTYIWLIGEQMNPARSTLVL